jgi:hypothetical protein
MKYQNLVCYHDKKRSFYENSRLINQDDRKKIKIQEFYFLLGRLHESCTDYLLNENNNKIYTIIRSGEEYQLVGLNLMVRK